MLTHRLRRWTNNGLTLDRCVVFAGRASDPRNLRYLAQRCVNNAGDVELWSSLKIGLMHFVELVDEAEMSGRAMINRM